MQFQAGDSPVFGPETRGLPAVFLNATAQNHILRIPMQPDNRSLKLSNATAIIVYEAWRHLAFEGAR